MRLWLHMKPLSRPEDIDATVIVGSSCFSSEHEPKVLNRTARLAERGADVLRPFPSWLVCRATDPHSFDIRDFEAPFDHLAYLVRLVESPEDCIENGSRYWPAPTLSSMLQMPLNSLRQFCARWHSMFLMPRRIH